MPLKSAPLYGMNSTVAPSDSVIAVIRSISRPPSGMPLNGGSGKAAPTLSVSAIGADDLTGRVALDAGDVVLNEAGHRNGGQPGKQVRVLVDGIAHDGRAHHVDSISALEFMCRR